MWDPLDLSGQHGLGAGLGASGLLQYTQRQGGGTGWTSWGRGADCQPGGPAGHLFQIFVFHTVSRSRPSYFIQCATVGSFSAHWQETLYNMFTFACLFLLPLLIMVLCYSRILLEISGKMKKACGEPAPLDAVRGEGGERSWGCTWVPRTKLCVCISVHVCMHWHVSCLSFPSPSSLQAFLLALCSLCLFHQSHSSFLLLTLYFSVPHLHFSLPFFFPVFALFSLSLGSLPFFLPPHPSMSQLP